MTGMVFAITTTGLANETSTHANAEVNQKKITAKQPKHLFFCPTIKDLKKSTDPNKLTWSAPNGWKSFEASFVNKIGTFLGAQWVGANVGQMTCIYHGVVKTSFPVLLIYKTLTLAPKGDKWSKDLGGYQNCKSSQQKDCPFQIRLRPKQNDIYEEVEKLKFKNGNGNGVQNPGF